MVVGWHHWLNGRELGLTSGVGDRQGGLACCGPWGCKELAMTEWLSWTEVVLTLLIFTTCVCTSSVMETSLLLGFEWSEFSHVLIFAHNVWERLDGGLQNWHCQQRHYVFFKKFLPNYAQSYAPEKQCLSPTQEIKELKKKKVSPTFRVSWCCWLDMT